jgi:dihydrofolate reductase
VKRDVVVRKLVSGTFVSLDGVMEAPDRWYFPHFDEAMGEAVGSQIAEADALLLGRVTYQELAAYWPRQGDDTPGAAFLNGATKYVVSTTLRHVDGWQNSILVDGTHFVAAIRRLKELPGKNINVTGSATLVRSLLRANLLDELRLLVHPIVVGGGKRLLDGDTGQHLLRLVDAQTFDTGVLYLTYRPADR